MIIYEVNLTIEPHIYSEYMKWLTAHVKEMLAIDGFQEASILLEHTKGTQKKVTVIYQVESNEQLDSYLKRHAPQMRQDGIKKFEGSFSATRRIFTVLPQ